MLTKGKLKDRITRANESSVRDPLQLLRGTIPQLALWGCSDPRILLRTGNQLGKTYPYLEVLRPESAELAIAVKRALDPQGVMNPGVLGLEGP